MNSLSKFYGHLCVGPQVKTRFKKFKGSLKTLGPPTVKYANQKKIFIGQILNVNHEETEGMVSFGTDKKKWNWEE